MTNFFSKLINKIDKGSGLTLGQRLLGAQMMPTDAINIQGVDTTSPEYKENMAGAPVDITVSQNPKLGGILPDISAGYRENRFTPASLNNFNQNTLEDGRKKGFAYKLGEGLGSFAKLAESPLGRGLIVGGLVKATGGDGLEALTYGSTASMINQGNRLKDRMYRNELEKMGFDTTGLTGYVSDDTFNKIFQSKQLQDNAEYRNAMLASQQKNQDLANRMAQDRLEYQKMSDAADRALKSRGLDIQEQKLLDNKNNANIGNLQAVSNQLKRFEDSFATMPNKLESNTFGRLRAATGFQTKEEANFDSQRTLLFNKIARDLGGEKGVLSDQDIKRIEKSLPSYTDSAVQKQAKMQAIYDLLNDRLAVEGANINQLEDNDPLGVR